MAQRVDVQYIQFYTQGSAAQRVMPAISTYFRPLPKIKKHKAVRICVDPVAILGTLVAVCMLIMMLVGLQQLQVAQEQTAQMDAYVQRLEFENRQLKAEYAASCDLDAIEQTALALGMIPQSEAVHTEITVEAPPVEAPVTMWNRIGTFLTGLFA